MSLKNYVLPATSEEVEANRAAFVQALLTEPASTQCYDQLYKSPEDRGLTGAEAANAKDSRCAVGLAGTLFFGITNQDELNEWEDEPFTSRDIYQEASGILSRDIYQEVGRMLGLDNTGSGVSVSDIYGANDDREKSFSQIGAWLRGVWQVEV